ncbi:hypothetical protein FACS189444_3190 [Spirochaetia bacterium]|nr:hypothetical protein FACS189444_3190 [Spirochaetia bacterium]
MSSKCGAGIAAMRFDWPRQEDFYEGVREMDYRTFGALVTLKNTGAITKQKFIQEWRRNQKREGVDTMPSTAYLLGPNKPISFIQRLIWRFGIGRSKK